MNHMFTGLLMHWHKHQNRREMPWKGEKDPYRIWLSEIILQQTRVEQGWAYYERFIDRYPRVFDLAAAPDQEVFKLWEGLGYYSRCRNLLHTARTIVRDYQGRFPDQYKDILALKGIGAYTAAAIASFAYNLPYPVVDGNVTRVLARVVGLDQPVDSTPVRKAIAALAEEALDRKDPGAFNQAMMDFGATVCKPRQPDCLQCPLSGICVAYQEGRTAEIPVKQAKPAKTLRHFYYLMVEYRGQVLLRERNSKDIWRHLHEFVLAESGTALSPARIGKHPAFGDWLPAGWIKDATISREYRQQLSHQEIRGQFLRLVLKQKPIPTPEGYAWVPRASMAQLPFPRFINAWLDDQGIMS